jgi:hypothetical protein
VAVTEDIELRITVDGRQAQKALDETRAAAEKMGGGAARAVGSLEGLQKGAQALQQRLAPTAAAISSVSSALGQTGGEAGKVVAGIGQMAAAFGAGGPWAVAVMGGTMLLDEYLRTQKETTANLAVGSDAFRTYGQALREGTLAATNDLVAKLREARREVIEFGKTQGELDVLQAKGLVRDTEARLANLDKSIERRQALTDQIDEQARRLGITGAERDELNRQAAENYDLLGKERARRAELSVQLKTQSDATRGLIKAESELAALQRKNGGGGGGGGATRTGDVQGLLAKEYGDRLKLLQDFAADQQKQQAEADSAAAAAAEDAVRAEIADRDKWDAYELGLVQAKEDARAKIEKDAAEKRKTLRADEIRDAQATYGALVTSAAQALGTFVAESAAGQEAALASLLKAASQQAGGFVMLQGGQLIAEGIRNTFSVVTAPLGAAQIAGGAGLVAAGAAIQAGGPLAVSSLLGQSGGGAPTAGVATADPGARARGPRTMPSDGGGTQLTIVYGGLSGPTADDGARALKKGEQRARRRGY